MNKLFPVAWVVTAVMLSLTGCDPAERPSPDDTLLGPPTAPAMGNDGGSRGVGGPAAPMDRVSPLDVPLQARDPSDSVIMLDADRQQVLESIFFGFDEFNIRPDERAKLSEVATRLTGDASTRVIAEGHTSWHGTEEYNLGLGDRRAQAVKSFLEQLGVAPDRVSASSMGELEATPEVPRDDPSARNDRRVDLIMVR